VPADLAALPSLALGAAQDEHIWQMFGPDDAQASIHHRPRFVTGSMPALRAAAIAGGVVQLPTMMIGAEFARGELMRVLPDWAPRREIIHAVFASRRGLLPSVRALIDFLAEQFRMLDAD
jgi:DNA-binding transcriptional LysR family regulator